MESDSHTCTSASTNTNTSTDTEGMESMFKNIIKSRDPFCLLPENDDIGNIEYKVRLDTWEKSKRYKLITQSRFRISEGKRLNKSTDAIFIIGIDDDGNLPPPERCVDIRVVNLSVKIFKETMTENGFEIVNEEEIIIGDKKLVAIKIRPEYDDLELTPEINVNLVGPTDSGKTSLLSLIVCEEEDDGEGYSRDIVNHYEHEKKTGTTSSIIRKFIGFKGTELINEESCIEEGMEHIYSESDRYVAINDLPGHGKFIKTTLYGLLSSKNDIAAICIPANDGIGILKKNLQFYQTIWKICQLRKSKVIFLLTKIDSLPKTVVANYVSAVQESLVDLLKINTVKIFPRIENTKKKFIELDMKNPYLTCVTSMESDGALKFIRYLSQMSQKLSTAKAHALGKSEKSGKVFITNEIFECRSSGNIFYGHVDGDQSVELGDELNVISSGKIAKCTITSIRKKNIEATKINPGETGSISVKPNVRRCKDAVFYGDEMSDNVSLGIVLKLDKRVQSKDYLLFNGSSFQGVKVDQWITQSYNNRPYITLCKKGKKIYAEKGSVCVIKDEKGDLTVGIVTDILWKMKM